MNHKELIKLTVRRSGICQATVEHVLPACFQIIREAIVTGEHRGSVKIPGFGTFYAQNRKTNIADAKDPGKRITGYRLVPRFLPTTGFKDDVLHERVSPDARCFHESSRMEKPHPSRNRKYHFRTKEAKQHMSSVGKANSWYILRAKQMHISRSQDPTTIRQEPVTREEIK